jgi:hypothetical protein
VRWPIGGSHGRSGALPAACSAPGMKAAWQQLFHKTDVRTRSQLARAALEQYRDQL